MNKTELINHLATKLDINKKQAGNILNIFTRVIIEALQKGEIVALSDLGKFGIKHRTARPGVNPKTKQIITLPAKTKPYFKASKKLKDIVNTKLEIAG